MFNRQCIIYLAVRKNKTKQKKKLTNKQNNTGKDPMQYIVLIVLKHKKASKVK